MKNATYEKLVQDWKAKRISKGEWNPEILWAYKNTYEKNERLDFKDLVEEDKIPDLVKELRRVGITEFTISSAWGDLVSRLAIWQAEGPEFAESQRSFTKARELNLRKKNTQPF